MTFTMDIGLPYKLLAALVGTVLHPLHSRGLNHKSSVHLAGRRPAIRLPIRGLRSKTQRPLDGHQFGDMTLKLPKQRDHLLLIRHGIID